MLQVMANANIELGDPLKVDLAKLRVYSLTGLRGSPIVQVGVGGGPDGAGA